ncbi:oligosaccharide flippase family protein, partial [Methanobrevibacter sp.]|uniref:oligosaccharide flippase family protein n=1 Tax=Methanobrevibacter sp. TaxID=66852 RepID=UPI003976384F
MSQIKTIFKNMSWVMISQILVSILGFFWTILIARYLGVEKYGIIGFATSIVGIFSITLDLGVTSYIVRQIATDNGTAHKNLGNVFPLKCLLSIGTFVLLFIVLILMKYDELTITITLLFMINSIVQTIISTINGSFQAFEKMKYQGIGNTLLNVLLFIFIIISIYTDLGIMGITISYIIANVIGL